MADGPKKKRGKRGQPAHPTHASDGRKHTPAAHVPKVGEVTKQTGKPRRSPAAKVNPKVNMSTWRRKLQQSRIKFDDNAKKVFLDAFRENNLKMRACDKAGVALSTCNEHLKNDPDFASAYDQAVQEWRDHVVDTAIVKIALEGIPRERLKDGEVVERWTEHPVQLLLAELRRVDHGFRDKSTLEVQGGGGVLIAPADMTPAEWMEAQRLKNETRTNPMLEIENKPGETLPDPLTGKVPETQKVIRG